MSGEKGGLSEHSLFHLDLKLWTQVRGFQELLIKKERKRDSLKKPRMNQLCSLEVRARQWIYENPLHL